MLVDIRYIMIFQQKKDRLKTFAKAENIIPIVRKAFDDIFCDHDVIVMPTTDRVAPKLPLVEKCSVKGNYIICPCGD